MFASGIIKINETGPNEKSKICHAKNQKIKPPFIFLQLRGIKTEALILSISKSSTINFLIKERIID